MPVISNDRTGNETVAASGRLLITRTGGVDGNVTLNTSSQLTLQGYVLGDIFGNGQDFQLDIAAGGLLNGVLQLSAFGYVRNAGEIISAGTNAITGAGAAVSIINSGSIFGAISLGYGNDFLDSRNGYLSAVVNGSLGDDTLLGGVGADTMLGGLGNNRLEGGGGGDSLNGGDGANTVFGGLGADTMVAGWYNDLLDGGDDDDSMHGFGGANTLLGGLGADTIAAYGGNDLLDGGDGADSMAGSSGDDTYVVDNLRDRITEIADQGTDTILLRLARFSLTGRQVENVIGDTPDQAFIITGNTLANVLTGGDFADSLAGGANADTLNGLDGQDSLDGGTGNDLLDGGAGDDTLQGGTGADFLRGDGLSFEAEERFDPAESPFYGIHEGFEAAPSFTDLDGDGDLDLVVGARNGRLSAFQRNGDGSYTAMDGAAGRPANPFAGIDVGSNSIPAFTDLDSDGDLDLVVGRYDNYGYDGYDGTPLSFRRNGDGSFTAMDGAAGRPANPFAGIDVGSNSIPAFTDLDGDGDLDMVLGTGGERLSAFSRNGDGSFTAMDGTSGRPANPFAGIDVGWGATPSFTDLDSDGDLDLVVGSGEGTLSAFRRDGANFTALTGSANPFNGIDVGWSAAPSFADLDGDGILDLVVGSGDGTLRVFSLPRGQDSLAGGAGNDTLDGGMGADTMAGGTGNDAFYVDDAGDVVQELAGQGTDTILLRLGNYTLSGTTVENITGAADRAFAMAGNGLANVLTGAAQADTLNGDAGNDSLNGSAGSDSLLGGNGNDRLDGGADADTLSGGAGNDMLLGGNGADWASYAELTAASQAITVNLVSGRATGAAGNDTLTGIENIRSGAGDDTLLGDGLANMLSGGAGNDSLFGGGGLDWVSYAELTLSSQAVTVDLVAGRATGAAGNDTLASLENILGGAGNDSLLGDGLANTLDGGAGADTMAGGNGNDVYIVGYGDVVVELNGQGIDSILLRWGAFAMNTGFVENVTGDMAGMAFSIIGNSLANRLTGGSSADILLGGANHDTLIGDAGNDSLMGDDGNDRLDGGVDADTLSGGAGNDNLIGGGGADWASYAELAAASQAITVNLVTGRATGAAGSDTLAGIENILAGAGNDSLLGDSLANFLMGGAGNDTLVAGDGNASLAGGLGHDSILGGNGRDWVSYAELTAASQGITLNLVTGRVTGAAGNDTLSDIEAVTAGAGNDSLLGGALNSSYLDGAAGQDTLQGGTGQYNRFYGGAGADQLLGVTGTFQWFYGEAGNDTLVAGGGDYQWLIGYRGGETNEDLFSDDGGADSLVGGSGSYQYLYGDGGADTLVAGSGDYQILIGRNNVSYNGAVDGADSLMGGSGISQRLEGDEGNDTLMAGGGVNQQLEGGEGADSLVGGAGAYQYVLGGTGNDTLAAGGGNNQVLSGDEGDDSLQGGAGNDQGLYGNQGNDTIVSGGGNGQQLSGGDGNDSLLAQAGGAQTLLGDTGNDTLNGGIGNDSLDGGEGQDHFIFASSLGASNVDTINGYSAVDDTIVLDDAFFTAIGAPGSLAAGAFTTGTAATEADDRIIFNSATGALFYDADGSGAGAAVQFATLTSLAGSVTHADFLII